MEAYPGGSGSLAITVYADGSTRVLRLADRTASKIGGKAESSIPALRFGLQQHPLTSLPVADNSAIVPGLGGTWLGNIFTELHLPGGIGVSIIDHHAQEILFASSRDIRFDATVDPHVLTAHLKIGYAQVRLLALLFCMRMTSPWLL